MIIYSTGIFLLDRLNSYTLLFCILCIENLLLLPFQDIENQLAIKSKALDELRQSYLTLESGATPLLEDAASGISELLRKRDSVIHQVLDSFSVLFLST